MAGELEQYIQNFQSYVNAGRLVTGIKDKPVPPPKPQVATVEEAKAIEVIEKQIETKKIELPIEFDSQLYHTEVLKRVEGTHGEKNPLTIAYQASDLGFLTPCRSLTEARGYMDYLSALYEIAFSAKWGYGYGDALEKVTEPGCPTCTGEFAKCGGSFSLDTKALYMGIEYYDILRKLVKVLNRRNAVYDLTDWNKVIMRLGKNPSLLAVSVLSEM